MIHMILVIHVIFVIFVILVIHVCHVSDPWYMLKMFCFHVYAETSLYIVENAFHPKNNAS